MRDASLDEFATGSEESDVDRSAAPADELDSEADDDPGTDAATGTGGQPSDVESSVAPDDEVAAADAAGSGPEDVAPAVSTYDFSPDGAACAACGTTVEKRWRDDAGLVCADCKNW